MFRKFALAAAAAVALIAGEASAEKVTVGVLKLASSGPVFISYEKGFFKDAGLEVELKFFEAAQPISVAVVSGDIDFGVTAFTAGFFNLAGKGALKVIGAQSREEPGYPLIAYMAANKAFDGGFNSIDKFAGKTIGITQTGSSFHYSLGLLADKQKFDFASVRLVPLQSIPNMVSALKGGQVDGVLMPATVAIPMAEKGEAKLLGFVGDQTPWQLGALFTSTRMVQSSRATAEKFVAGYQKGAQAFFDAFLVKDAQGKVVGGPAKAEMVQIIAKHTGQAPESVPAGIPYVDPQARLLVSDVYNQVRWFQGQGLVDKAVDAKQFLDLGFVQGHLDLPK
jgi:NitT/TauT family transport system substrate-binding protein